MPFTFKLSLAQDINYCEELVHNDSSGNIIYCNRGDPDACCNFNKLGGPRTPKAPKTPNKTPRTPVREITRSGGVKKTKRRGKPKIEEPQRLKLELALRNFLINPPDKQRGGEE